MKFTEIEFKYKADLIPLSEFIEFCESRKPFKKVSSFGADHFYENKTDLTAFFRFRVGSDITELTFKRKLNQDNNFIRVENNIQVLPNTSEEQIAGMLSSLGFFRNTTIYKQCVVYFFDYYVLSYYVCYNKDLKELGRFVEIEMKEDYPFLNEEEAWNRLLNTEKLCKSLGILSKNRILFSLYEMYKEG